MKTSTLSNEEKYLLYEKAVQCPSYDVDFLIDEYTKINKSKPYVLREDFCGTGAISCEWVTRGNKNTAIGVDLDSCPIEYGIKNHYSKLSTKQQDRMQYVQKNVLQANYKSDVIAALNFSYCIFKSRPLLLKYFKAVRKSLNPKGIFVCDIFGGLDCQQKIEDRVEHDNFTYYWDCDDFNPLNNECLYKIHFKKKGEKRKIKDVFVYDWRLWTIPELKDILCYAGFSNVNVFWEGDDGEGGGNGEYSITDKVDNCESWVCYLFASV